MQNLNIEAFQGDLMGLRYLRNKIVARSSIFSLRLASVFVDWPKTGPDDPDSRQVT